MTDSTRSWGAAHRIYRPATATAVAGVLIGYGRVSTRAQNLDRQCNRRPAGSLQDRTDRGDTVGAGRRAAATGVRRADGRFPSTGNATKDHYWGDLRAHRHQLVRGRRTDSPSP